jgi:hypothetical protein
MDKGLEMGTPKTDVEIASQLKQQLGNNPDITDLQVTGHLLKMHVTPSLSNRLAADRERGRKIVLMLMDQMKKLTGRSDVAVWVFSENQKFVEGSVKQFGGDNVNYLFDL